LISAVAVEQTPHELVTAKYGFPFKARPLQIEPIDRLAPLSRSGWWAEVGTGKTYMSTVVALYKNEIGETDQWFVLVPPILIPQWHKWLTKKVTGTSAVMYRGTPKQRKELPLNADFIIMSMQVFKNDFDYLSKMFEHRKVGGLVDEATSIKNVKSQNHKRTRDFFTGRDLLLLTGTPLSTPGDAYAYIKLLAPAIYRNQRHFESLHVEERDYFDNITRWGNLDFLHENMLVNSMRMLKREAMPYLKDPLYDTIEYELDPAHMALYKKLADEQLLILEDGGKIDATTVQKLYNALQQIVCNPWHFSGDETMLSAAHELLDQVVDELAMGDPEHGRKLIIFSKYKMTNRGLLQYLQPYGFVGFYSEISQRQQEINKERFIDDPNCWGVVGNPQSAAYGTDGWQAVCSDMLFLEAPTVAKDFNQAVGRIDRDGQLVRPHIRIAQALGTIQNRLYNRLLKNDHLVNQVQGGWRDLRDAVYGAA
jgi:SNF2 family DNA or RNA helicase